MSEKEMQAHDMVRRRSWSRAVALYDQILNTRGTHSSATESSSTSTPSSNPANNASGSAASAATSLPSPAVAIKTRIQKDRQIVCLLGRCECLLELGKYDNCLYDANRVLGLLADQSSECLASYSRARRWLVHVLCKIKKYSEAEQELRNWISDLNGQQGFSDITKTLERYKVIVSMLNGNQKTATRISSARLEEEMSGLDTKLEHWATNNLPLDKYSKLLSNKGLKKREGGTPANGNNGQSTNGSSASQSAAHLNGSATPTTAAAGSASSATATAAAGTGSGSESPSGESAQKTADLLAAINITGGKHSNQEDQDEAQDGDDGEGDGSGGSNAAAQTTCSYCAITFKSRNELREHCQTESHQNIIMSDEGRDWKWRPPPRGFTLDCYGLCESHMETQTCHYGNQCVEAHGIEELNEWKERLEYRKMRLQKACEKELYGKSYTEQILERWIQATAPERIMCEKVEGVVVKCEQELTTTISSKSSKREWVFTIKAKRELKAVALLQDAHRSHFAVTAIKCSVLNNDGEVEAKNIELKSNQEWVAGKGVGSASDSPINSKLAATSAASGGSASGSSSTSNEREETKISSDATTVQTANKEVAVELEHHITIEFHTDIFGTFRQAVCFDLHFEPLVVRHLCVDVVPVNDAEKIEEIKRDIINSSATRWDVSNTQLTKFETTIGSHLKTEAYLNDIKHEKELSERYPCPRAATFTLTQSTIVEKRLTQNNYRSRIHELLYVEEIARYEQIARFNVRTRLMVTSNYILTPAGMATSTAKYSLSGELFALMRLGKDISEDTSAGRLILSNCSSVYIASPEDSPSNSLLKDKKRKVYEALIEDKGKNVIYLKLSAKCVEDMGLKAETDIDVDIQFQLNRMSYCEWHNAVDKITDFKIIFPETDIEPNIPWTPKKQWSDTCEPKLNAKQREAVNAITTSLNIKLPPILLIGPFGTGKTYTLAQAIKQLLTQPDARILICTHSNSAADLYIKEYLHPWIEDGLTEATPLRVYYHKRWVATVNQVVQKYCITDDLGNFRRPSVEDIMKHRIVVVTLSISMELSTLGLPKGYFTHIFLDEAAQAMECEAIMPLALANDSTRIVLAGDHMQMSPELFSNFAKERKLHISLLERLYDHYPSNFPCKILLCENYRAHEAIIRFTSELFYEQKLIASGKQPRHDRFYPLTFFTTRGEDIQDKNSTAFYNNAEVYELVERVSELRKRWPSSWGKISDSSIGIMTPYADQVFRIRSELRKRRMGGISVERVLNVQGKQFRAVFLSTVRTRRTCLPQQPAQQFSSFSGQPGMSIPTTSEDNDYGFLSNSKLLNTAITRAQSLVAVVGDPVALCSIGRCRKVWERFIEICDENKSLFGITWTSLRSQLDGVELKRAYVLNPLAPEFIPRALQPEAYVRDQAAMFLMGNTSGVGASGGVGGHHGGHGGPLMPHGVPPHHNSGPLPSHSNAGMPPMPSQHPAAAATSGANQQLAPHMFGPYNAAMLNQGMAAGGASGKGGPGMPPFPGHGGNSHQMGAMPPMGPPRQTQQPPQPPPGAIGQQFNPRGPPPAAPGIHPPGTPGHYSYMAWQQVQQQQQQQQLRGGPHSQQPPVPGSNMPPQPTQNPNASLWGPPPQSNPWSVLPKQSMQPNQPLSNTINNTGRQMTPLQQPGNPALRGNSVPMQPSLPPNQQPPQPAIRNNPNDLSFLPKKPPFGQQQHGGPPPPPNVQPPHGNFPVGFGAANNNVPSANALPPLLNQPRNASIQNGPISPMDPYIQRPPPAQPPGPPPGGNVAAPNNFFGSGNNNSSNNSSIFKDKDLQFLNNMHAPLGMLQNPASAQAGMLNNSSNKQQSPTALRFLQQQQQQQQQVDYSNLLPPNMSFHEMAFEPKDSQYKWYVKLIETQGQEAGNKFMEFLRQVTNMVAQQQQQLSLPPNHVNKLPSIPPHIQQQQQQQQQQQLQMAQSHMNLPRDLMQQNMLQQPPVPGVGNLLNPHQFQQPQQQQQQQQRGNHHPFMPSSSGQLFMPHGHESPPLDGGENINQQVDMVFNSLINGNDLSQPILRDIFGVLGSDIMANAGLTGPNAMNINGDLLMSPKQQQQQQQQSQQMSQSNKPFSVLDGAGDADVSLASAIQKTIFNWQQQQPPQQPQQQQQQQHASPPIMPSSQSLASFSSGSAGPPMSASHQQQSQANIANLMANSAASLLQNKELLLSNNSMNVAATNNPLMGSSNAAAAASTASSMSASSVPLYRRQATPLHHMVGGSGNYMGGLSFNGDNFNGAMQMPPSQMNGANLGMGAHLQQHQHALQQQQQQNLQNLSMMSSAGSSMDNMLANDILTGLGTSGGNLIEALFHSNSRVESGAKPQQQQQQAQQHHQQQQQQAGSSSSSMQNMFFNNFTASDLFTRGMGVSVTGAGNGSEVAQRQHMLHSENLVGGSSGGSGSIGSSAGNSSIGAASKNMGGAGNSSNANSNSHLHHTNAQVTYAAVLSQGPLGPSHKHPVHASTNAANPSSSSAANSGDNRNSVPGNAGAAQSQHANSIMTVDKDPFAAIRELGKAPNGYYNYFQ